MCRVSLAQYQQVAKGGQQNQAAFRVVRNQPPLPRAYAGRAREVFEPVKRLARVVVQLFSEAGHGAWRPIAAPGGLDKARYARHRRTDQVRAVIIGERGSKLYPRWRMHRRVHVYVDCFI
jgi:hypothetical protein